MKKLAVDQSSRRSGDRDASGSRKGLSGDRNGRAGDEVRGSSSTYNEGTARTYERVRDDDRNGDRGKGRVRDRDRDRDRDQDESFERDGRHRHNEATREGYSRERSRDGLHDRKGNRDNRDDEYWSGRGTDKERSGGNDRYESRDRHRARDGERDVNRQDDKYEDRNRNRERDIDGGRNDDVVRENYRDGARDGDRDTDRSGHRGRYDDSNRDRDRDRERDSGTVRGSSPLRRSLDKIILKEGMPCEAQYKGKGKWYKATVKYIHEDNFIDVEYDDGERDFELHPECVKAIRPKNPVEVSNNVALRDGDKVEGNYRGKGKWYAGKITRDRRDGTFDISYDDGESESRVEESMIRLIGGGGDTGGRSPSKSSNRIEEGSKVEGNYRGKGKWYPGKVTRDRGDGTFDISYDDGESETRVEGSMIRLLGGSSSSSLNVKYDDDVVDEESRSSRSGSSSSHQLRDLVTVRLRGSQYWIAAEIRCANRDGTFDVLLDEGGLERDIPADCIKTSRSAKKHNSSGRNLFRGDSIEVKTKSGSRQSERDLWRAGKVLLVNSDDSVDVEYSDGQKQFNVSSSNIRELVNVTLGEGDKVEARYRGRSKYYPGKIVRDRGDGTYDISYDDGESETKVVETYIKLIEVNSLQKKSEKQKEYDFNTQDNYDAPLRVDQRIDFKYEGKDKLYKGRISRVRLNGTYDVEYEDGEKEIGLARNLIFPIGSNSGGGGTDGDRGGSRESGRIEEGSKVEGNYRGKGKWYAGKITRDRRDGTFDISYDDGESESRVEESMIRLIGGGGDTGGGGRSPSKRFKKKLMEYFSPVCTYSHSCAIVSLL